MKTMMVFDYKRNLLYAAFIPKSRCFKCFLSYTPNPRSKTSLILSVYIASGGLIKKSPNITIRTFI